MPRKIDDGLTPQERYDAKNTKQVVYRFSTMQDKDILDWLDHQESKQGSVKAAIRCYMLDQKNLSHETNSVKAMSCKLNTRYDKDVLDWLDRQESKHGSVKAAIRYYMAKQQNPSVE